MSLCVLLVFLVGKFARDRIGKLQKTERYVPEDFDTISLLLSQFDRLLSTPNIMTEVSNLCGHLGEPLKGQIAGFVSNELLPLVDETYVQTSEAAKLDIFPRLGLTDAGIAMLAANKVAVLTDDGPLYRHLCRTGVDAIKFSHVAPLGWRM